MVVLTHNQNGYNHGCRCDVCRTAKSEHMKAYRRIYYPTHRVEESNRGSSYYQSHRTEVDRRHKAYRTANPSIDKASNRRRRVRKLGTEGNHTEQEWQALLDWYGRCCANCDSSEDITRDHIVPLSRGGTDYISNIQPLCRSCNCKKGANLG